jgi:hypothetical protein
MDAPRLTHEDVYASFVPTSEELALSALGQISADDVLDALGVETFRSEDFCVWVAERTSGRIRRANREEVQLHEQSVYDYHYAEAEAGII